MATDPIRGEPEVHINRLVEPSIHNRSLLVAVLVVTAFGLFSLLTASRAYASHEEFCSGVLLDKGQSCHSGALNSETDMFFISGENSTNNHTICVAPVRLSNGEAPYGWSCGGFDYSWEFTPISGVAAAVENPNSTPEAIGGVFLACRPPTATTKSASGLSPTQTTLNGGVSSNECSTNYYFQYGKTTSYGSSTAEGEAGFAENQTESGTISGLESGTTYHYRLVAKSDGGTVYGVDEAFTTPAPPTATTEAATGVTQTHSTLNGTVAAGGSETHYHFEYGTTSSYGSSTPEGNAGSGRGSELEQATLTGLEPNTTYHYRLVASNTWGVSYGKETLTTTHQEDDTNTGWALRNPVTGRQILFYQGSNHEIDAWNYESSTGWTSGEHGGHAAASGTVPSVIDNPSTGRIAVFYQGSNNQIDAWNYEGGEWTWGEHGGHAAASGTSPSAVYNPSTGRIAVFYQGSNNQIDAWNYEGGEWTWGEHGGHAAASGTSPSAVYNPSTGRIAVFYHGSNNQIDAWNYEGKEWTWGEHNGHAAGSGTNPSVSFSPETGHILVFYHGSNNQIDTWDYEGKEWVWGEHGGHAAASGASPVVLHDPESGDMWVYYLGSSSAINDWSYATEWTWGEP
jgi:hypothetical protein